MAKESNLSPHDFTQLGGRALLLLASWQIVPLAVIAPVLASRLVAGEVEEGTLLPLMASGRSLASILLARLLGVLSLLLLLIMTGLPLYALPLLIGGISVELILRSLVLQAATAVGLAGLGLLCSSLGRRAGAVALLAALLGVSITLGGALLPSGRSTTAVYERAWMIRIGMLPPGNPQPAEPIPTWLYPNPLVGLNTALNPGMVIGLLNLPGADAPPVFRAYRLWQLQAAAAPVIALAAVPLASLVVWIRVRWRWPTLRPRVKERMSDG